MQTGTKSTIIVLVMSFLLLGISEVSAQLRTTTWEKCAKLSNRPAWMSTTNTERGIAYGNDRIYVTSTNGGLFIQVLSAATGELTGTLDMSGVSGGSGAAIADVETDANGVIYACNLVTNASASAFKIYRWANDAATPVNIISFSAAGYRLGDKFTVVGSAANNTLTIYAATTSTNKLYKWTTTDNGNTFAVDSITLSGVSTTAPGASPAVYPLASGTSEFVFKSNGSTLRRFHADGSVIDTILSTLLPTGSNAVRYFTTGGKKYVVAFMYSGTPQNGLRLIDVTNQYSTQHLVLDYSPSIGATSNTNGTGDVSMKVEADGSYSFYMLATNNGIAAQRYYFGALPNTVAVNSFPYAVSFDNGLITDAGWSGNFADRGTESKTGPFAARFLWNYIPTTHANRVYGHLVSPRIELPADYRVRFWWKDDDITTIIGADTTFFEVSTDNGVNWTTLRYLSSTGSQSAYVEEIVDLGAYAGNSFRMRFRDKTNGTGSAYGTGVDEILIEEKSQSPSIEFTPASLNFNLAYVGGMQQRTVTIRNTGVEALTVNLTLPPLISANQYVMNIPGGETSDLLLTYTPIMADTLNDSILVTTNDPNNVSLFFKLAGRAEFPFVMNEVVQNFDTSTGTIPANWAGNFSMNAVGGVGNSKRLTKNLYLSTSTGSFSTPFFLVQENSKLRFKYRVVNYVQYPDTATPRSNFKIYISVSTNYGATFVRLDSIGEHNHSVSLAYAEKSWDLTDYSGETIQIRIDGQRIAGDFYLDFDDWFMGTLPFEGIGLFVSSGEDRDTLRFGLHPDGTNGLDTALGEIELPPVPLPGIFNARFQLPVIPIVSSRRDYRSDQLQSVDWVFSFQPGISGYPIVLKWNPDELGEWNYRLRDMITGDIINVNLKDTGQYVVTNTAIQSLKIEYRKQHCFDISVKDYWNLVSVPVAADSMGVTHLFPTVTANMFMFDSVYVSVTNVNMGKGYWARFNGDQVVTICGIPVENNLIPLKSGWNLIGGFENDVAISRLTTTPPDLITTNFFGYNNGYMIADSLLTGRGYWVRSNASGVINMPVLNSNPYTKQHFESNLITTITITDATGSSATLIAGKDGEQYEMPPLPPTGIFDARYATNRYAASIETEESIILSSATYPVRVKVTGGSLTIGYGDKSESLSDGGEAIITNPSVQRITVSGFTNSTNSIPTEYSLHQNYPNPFNPTTTIRFDLPEKSEVTLTVFNALGESVATLINGSYSAGSHTVSFNAANLTSGVYFYQIVAGAYVRTLKMIMMK